MIKRCEICNKEFKIKPSQLKRGRGRFCSLKCYDIYHKAKWIQKKCKNCNQLFWIELWKLKRGARGWFCSKKCRGEWMRKTQNLPNPYSQVNLICKNCRKEYKVEKWESRRSNFCSRECYAIWKSQHSKGDLNNNWKGGLSNEPYPFEFNKEIKELIRYRDGYKCQRCGCPEIENGRKLDIHHIDYNKQNLNPDNLISICRSCNSIVNFNREKWERNFSKKIKKIMNSNVLQLSFNGEKKMVIKNV